MLYVDAVTEENYAPLRGILLEAYRFMAYGKGEERHGEGKHWDDQAHILIAEAVGQGFALGQVMKKAHEAMNLDDWDAARRELLGAIGYLASAIRAGDMGID